MYVELCKYLIYQISQNFDLMKAQREQDVQRAIRILKFYRFFFNLMYNGDENSSKKNLNTLYKRRAKIYHFNFMDYYN